MNSNLNAVFTPEVDAVMQRGVVTRKMYNLAKSRSEHTIGLNTMLMTWFMIYGAVLLAILFLPFKVSSPTSMAAAIGGHIFLAICCFYFFADLFLLVGCGYVSPSFNHYQLIPGTMVTGTVLWLALLPTKLIPGFSSHFNGWRSMAVFLLVAVGMTYWARKRAGQKVWRGVLFMIGDVRTKQALKASAKQAEQQSKAQPAPAAANPANPAQPAQTVQPAKRPFALQVGRSTGHLASIGHKAGMAPNLPVVLKDPDMFQNIMIWGGIGSGKTTRLISPLLYQILIQDAGALVFDMKADFIREMDFLAQQAGREYQIVGDGGYACNLFKGLTPEVATEFISSAFLLDSGGRGDAFWNTLAANLCRSSLSMLKFIPGKYSLAGLYEYVFLPDSRNDVNMQIDALLNSGDMDFNAKRELQMAREFYENVFQQYEDKVKSNVLATVSQVLTPFRNPAMMDAFCGADDTMPEVEFPDMLNKGSVFLVEIPVTKYGKEGSKFAYLFVKLRFMMMMKERRMRREWNQDRPVGFVCDEYHVIIDGISDTDFWDKSRSSRTVGLVSMQGFSSMVKTIGKRDIAEAILQNFRQRICLSTDDIPTIDLLGKQAGQADVEKESASSTEGENKGESQQMAGQMGRSQSSGESFSTSRSYSVHRQNVIDGELFNNLADGQAVALLKLGNVSHNDVINTVPLYVPKDYEIVGPAKMPTRQVAKPAAVQPVEAQPAPAVDPAPEAAAVDNTAPASPQSEAVTPVNPDEAISALMQFNFNQPKQ